MKEPWPSHNIKATGHRKHFNLLFLLKAKQTEQDMNLHFSPNLKRAPPQKKTDKS